MVQPLLRSPTRSFLAATGLVVALVFATILTASFSWEPGGARAGFKEEGSRYSVVWNQFFVEPGDVLRLPPPWGFNNPIRAQVSLYIVEGGEAGILATGQRPAHVYFEQSPIVFDYVDFRRPTPPAGKPHETPEGWSPPVDEYDTLDVAYVLDKHAVPESDRVWIAGFSRQANDFDTWDSLDPVVINGSLLRMQPFLLTLMAIAFVVFLVAGVRWIVSNRRPNKTNWTGNTEGLLEVAYSAKNYMLGLRRLTALNGVLLFFVGIFGLTAANYYMESLYPTSPFRLWNETIMLVLWIVFLVLMTVWTMHYRVMTREYRRIVTDTSRPPLDL